MACLLPFPQRFHAAVDYVVNPPPGGRPSRMRRPPEPDPIAAIEAAAQPAGSAHGSCPPPGASAPDTRGLRRAQEPRRSRTRRAWCCTRCTSRRRSARARKASPGVERRGVGQVAVLGAAGRHVVGGGHAPVRQAAGRGGPGALPQSRSRGCWAGRRGRRAGALTAAGAPRAAGLVGAQGGRGRRAAARGRGAGRRAAAARRRARARGGGGGGRVGRAAHGGRAPAAAAVRARRRRAGRPHVRCGRQLRRAPAAPTAALGRAGAGADGARARAGGRYLGDVWALELATLMWRPVSGVKSAPPTPQPPPREGDALPPPPPAGGLPPCAGHALVAWGTQLLCLGGHTKARPRAHARTAADATAQAPGARRCHSPAGACCPARAPGWRTGEGRGGSAHRARV